ncbi:exosome catalytic subunit dis3, partial [Balamuthia mandrillaris]
MADDLLGRYAEGGGSQLIPTTRVFFKKTKRGKIARLVREHYLRFSREDVEREQLFPVSMAVRSALLGSFFPLLRQEADIAQGQQQEATAELLAEGLPRHYVIPDVEITKHFLELFEFDHRLTDIIWLGTVLHEMREASQRAYNRLRAVVGDPRHRGMVFQNEHFAETWVPRLDTETPTQRNQR